MLPTHEGPPDQTIGRGVDHEFGFDAEQDAELEIQKPGDTLQGADKLVAQSVVALVKSGSSVSEAARACGQTVEALRQNSAARTALRRLKREYELDADELKQLVKARATELAIQNDDQKLALDATKVLAAMPDVGLTQVYAKVNVAIGVFSDETSKVLASIDPTEQ